MKTEEEIVTKLEEVIEALNKDTGGITEEEMDPEHKAKIAFSIGCLISLAWMADCEEELKPLLRVAKIQAISERLEGLV